MGASQVTLIVSFVTALVGISTVFIGVSQMKIASAKVKLDLYNKRFNIYLVTLDYYQSTYDQTQEGIKVKSVAFIKCYRESLFLFDRKDGIYETLTRIKDSGAVVRAYKEAKDDKDSTFHINTLERLHLRSVEACTQFGQDLELLEEQMVKYIKFTSVSGWTFPRTTPFFAWLMDWRVEFLLIVVLILYLYSMHPL